MVIKNVIVVNFDGQQNSDIRIEDSKITEVKESLTPFTGEDVIDGNGAYALPGAIDLNFHLQVLSSKKAERVEEGLKDAIRGGITTILAMPDTEPAIDNESVVEYLFSRSQQSINGAHVEVSGSLIKESDKKLANVAKLYKAGVAVVSTKTNVDSNVLRRGFEYSLMHSKPLFIMAKNDAVDESGVMHEGVYSTKLGLPAIPAFSESSEISKVVEISKGVKSKVHIQGVSAKVTVDYIKEQKKLYKNITADVLLPHLILTDESCIGFKTQNKIFPPLRANDDKLALIEAIKDGTIDCIASSHRAQASFSKDMPFELASEGIACASIFLPLLYTYLVENESIDLSQIVKLTSYNPSRVIGLNKGQIKNGFDGDIVLLDTKQMQKITHESTYSSVGNLICYNKEIKGVITTVVKGGRKVY